jgi:ribosomal protein S18 acetylase RimI-like enzyme
MVSIARLSEADRPALRQFWIEHWGADLMLAGGRIFKPDELDGFIAREGNEWVGLVTFYCEACTCEITSLDSLHPGQGLGTALLDATVKAARQFGCRKLKLITTNDNTSALRFYQKYGFELVALHRQAVNESRKRKPTIPELGLDSIPIRDEIELELHLAPPNPDLCT